jgi:hypothetical protein
MDGVSASDVYLQSWDELVTAKDRLLAEGWGVEVRDQPERGVRGFVGVRAGEVVRLRWAVYGRELSPKVRVCATWREFLTELEFRKEEDMEKSDSLEDGHVGFATYGRASTTGIAEVIRVPVSVLQEGGAEARSQLIRLLMSSKHPGAALLKGMAR